MNRGLYMHENKEYLYTGFRLTKPDIRMIRENYNKNIKTFKRNQVIIRSSKKEDLLGVVLKGTSYLLEENESAHRAIIEYFEEGDLFSNQLLLSLTGSTFYIVSKYPCEIAFLNYQQLNECVTKNRLGTANNLDYLSAPWLQEKMSAHIYILQQRTIRDKLMLYFNCLREKYNTNDFVLPLPFTDLADYLAIDRSAMMREIKKLNYEKVIKTERRNITII